MPQSVRGVIARSEGAPVEVVTITIPDPGPGEVVIGVQACGVCHTDLTYREGGINDEFPFLLGHEAAGVVEQVGPGVESVAVGDFVILNWRAVCGQCRACKRGRPQYGFDTHNAAQRMTLEDGTELTPALGIGAFAEKTLVHAGQCTKVDGDADPAIVGARLAGAGTIIAIDRDPRKLQWANELGATHTVDASAVDVVAAVETACRRETFLRWSSCTSRAVCPWNGSSPSASSSTRSRRRSAPCTGAKCCARWS